MLLVGDARVAWAQAKKSPIVVGWLGSGFGPPSAGANLTAFQVSLAAFGWKVGSQIVIEARWAQDRPDRLPALAAELAARKPADIVSTSGPVTRALVAHAPNIPIVQASVADPVRMGFAASLSRPGGMVTGLTTLPQQRSEKALEVLLLASPKVRRVGFLLDGNQRSKAVVEAAQRAAALHSVEVHFAQASRPEDLALAIASLTSHGVQAVIVTPSPFFTAVRKELIELARARGWPLAGSSHNWTTDGALISYGIDSAENFRRVAHFVDRILRGAKPGDLPIEQPMRIELVVNANTAKSLGLTLPPELLVRADKVIQ
jgi:putative ABC transport system substrate-binding protein